MAKLTDEQEINMEKGTETHSDTEREAGRDIEMYTLHRHGGHGYGHAWTKWFQADDTLL